MSKKLFLKCTYVQFVTNLIMTVVYFGYSAMYVISGIITNVLEQTRIFIKVRKQKIGFVMIVLSKPRTFLHTVIIRFVTNWTNIEFLHTWFIIITAFIILYLCLLNVLLTPISLLLLQHLLHLCLPNVLTPIQKIHLSCHQGAFMYDVRWFWGIFDLPTLIRYFYISIFSKIRCSLT